VYSIKSLRSGGSFYVPWTVFPYCGYRCRIICLSVRVKLISYLYIMNLNPVIKNIFFIITCPLVIAACTKSTSVTGSTSITYSANQHQDTFTVVDNGVTFSANSTFANIGECVIEKSPSGSLFSIRTFQTTSFPFGISLHNIPGPLDGAGIFKQALADSPGLVSSTSTVVELLTIVCR